MMAIGLSSAGTRSSLNCTSFIKEGISALSILYVMGFEQRLMILIACLLPFMAFSAWIGSKVFLKTSDRLFRNLILRFLLVIGLAVLGKTLFF